MRSHRPASAGAPVRLSLLVLLAVVAACGSTAAAAPNSGSGPDASAKRCKPGFRHAVIGGRHHCLRVGQRCRRRLDGRYHRYGFHCHGKRLTRRSTPPPAPPSPPDPPGTIRLEGTPEGVFVGEGSVWVAAHRAPLVVRIDPATDRVAATITVPVYAPFPVAFAPAGVWVGQFSAEGESGSPSGAAVSRIDPQTNSVIATIPGVNAAGVAYGAGSVWAAHLSPVSGELWRIDAQTNSVVAKIQVPPSAFRVAFAFDSVWVMHSEEGVVSRVDPATNAVVATIRPGPPGIILSLVSGEGALWVGNLADRRLYRIDPATNTATAIDIGASADVGYWRWGITVGAGSVWAKTGATTIARVDPRTNAVVQTVDVRPQLRGRGAAIGSLAVGYDALWVTIPDLNLLLRIPIPAA